MNSPLPELRATYRLQFHRDFPFAAAQALVPYLAGLGISHLYASPITFAVPGSTHGYDVADPTRINPELGGEEGFEKLAAALAAHGMGVILDIVPNHMAASSHNPYWMAVLECGPGSPAARIFDVIWEAGRLLLPVLGESLQATLASGALKLRADYDTGRLVVAHADSVFPLRPESVAELLAAAAGLRPGWAEMASDFRAQSASSYTSLHSVHEAIRLLDTSERAALDAVLAEADLPAMLEAQHWRLAWWRTGAHELNYRRFFNITDLAGVRVEDPEVFDLVHRLPLDLVKRGLVHGLRIDHIDGLVDPAGYCQRLREVFGEGIPIVVEKILEPGETLRPWPVDGTTGYERLNDINGLFVDPAGWQALEDHLRARQILVGTLPARLAEAKRQVLETSLKAELDLLAGLARAGLDDAMAAGDLTETALRQAVVAMLTHCPVYRSYATIAGYAPEDVAIWQSIRATIEANEDPLTMAAAALLLHRLEHPRLPSDLEFRSRFQQLSGPVLAKGFEDTELYRVPVLLAVNEVGGSLEHPSRSRAELHEIAVRRARAGARDLIPLATHDTKRGPDARARLDALSFHPQAWLDFIEEIQSVMSALAISESGELHPDPLDQTLIVQTLLSVWPVSTERIEIYLEKALREAKRHSSWETPNAHYEQAARDFATALIRAPEAEPFRAALARLLERLAPAARIVGLAQLVLQHTLPGTPDIYQGSEFRDFSLVDPDNRRPVDWGARLAALAGADDLSDDSDYEKFALTQRLLVLRRLDSCLTRGSYAPLDVEISPWRWFAFERASEGHAIRVAVATRVPDPAMREDGEAVLEFAAPWQGAWSDLDGAPLKCDGRRLILPSRRPLVVARKSRARSAG